MERNHASPVALPAAAASEALPIALLALGIASAASDLGSVLVKTPFLRSGVTAGDLIEGTGVYVVLALFAWVVRLALPGHGRPAALAAIAAVTFAFGHGIHLAANSIHDSLQRGRIPDPLGLADFWDEHAGHYLIDSGRILFAAALTWGVGGDARAGQAGTGGGSRAGRSGDFAAGAGGFVFGWILFAASVEVSTRRGACAGGERAARPGARPGQFSSFSRPRRGRRFSSSRCGGSGSAAFPSSRR